jgi:hypothetical protein
MVDRRVRELVGFYPCARRYPYGTQINEEDLEEGKIEYINTLGRPLYDAWQRIIQCNQDYGGCPQQCPVRKLIFKLQMFLPDRT